MKKHYKIIGFDADDTLWVNEPFFQETEKQFCKLLSDFQKEEFISKELYKVEMKNLELYGYGAKGFMLSMIETALNISNYSVSQKTIDDIITLGKSLLNKPVEILDGVCEVLDKLFMEKITLIVVTKGDLLDQKKKLGKSKIEKYFEHIEVMSSKTEADYLKLLSNLHINPEDFLMIGNSLKSDIIPVVNIGGFAAYIPYHTTWQHEKPDKLEYSNNYIELKQITELIKVLEI